MRKVRRKKQQTNKRRHCLPFDICSGTTIERKNVVCFSSFNTITNPIGKRFKQIAEHSKRTDHIMGFVLDFITKRTHIKMLIVICDHLQVWMIDGFICVFYSEEKKNRTISKVSEQNRDNNNVSLKEMRSMPSVHKINEFSKDPKYSNKNYRNISELCS